MRFLIWSVSALSFWACVDLPEAMIFSMMSGSRGVFAQEFGAGFRDEEIVFDADAEISSECKFRLDGDDHSGSERFAGAAWI